MLIQILKTQLVKNGEIFILVFKSQQVLYESGGEGWDLVCISLEAILGEERVFRRTGIFVLRDEDSRNKGLAKQIRITATVHKIKMV